MKKKILIGAVVILVLFLIILLNVVQGEKSKNMQGAILEKGDIKETVKMDGQVEAYKQVEVGSDVMGRIEKILVKERQNVKKGDLLCIIDPETYKARRDEIKSRLIADLARYRVLKNDYERSKELFSKNLISKSEFEKVEADYLSTKAQLQSDSFALKEAEENLKKCYIKSPIDGEVLRIDKEEGEMVIVGTISTPGSIIMVLADRNRMVLKGEVDETEIPKIKKGNRAIIKVDALPGKEFKGMVETVGGLPLSTSLQEGSALFPIEVMFLEKDSLLMPGMNATCEIITREKNNILRLPYSAVGKEKEKYYVFVKKQGKAKKVFIKTGIQGKDYIEVIEGLSEKDTVLIGPQKSLLVLKDGEKVDVKIKEKSEDRQKEENKKIKNEK